MSPLANLEVPNIEEHLQEPETKRPVLHDRVSRFATKTQVEVAPAAQTFARPKHHGLERGCQLNQLARPPASMLGAEVLAVGNTDRDSEEAMPLAHLVQSSSAGEDLNKVDLKLGVQLPSLRSQPIRKL